MKKDTVLKKYRILDYSKLSLEDLGERMDYFSKKYDEVTIRKMNHLQVKQVFSIMINMHNIIEELFKRFPEFKDEIDFKGAMDEILEKNQINASKN